MMKVDLDSTFVMCLTPLLSSFVHLIVGTAVFITWVLKLVHKTPRLTLT